MEKLTDDALTVLIRDVARAVDKCGPEGIEAAVKPLRDAGLVANMHLGLLLGSIRAARRNTLEWFGGQLLDVVDSKAWFAVNSWLNCVERFTGLTIGEQASALDCSRSPEQELVFAEETALAHVALVIADTLDAVGGTSLELAERVHVPEEHILRILEADVDVTVRMLARIAKGLGGRLRIEIKIGEEG